MSEPSFVTVLKAEFIAEARNVAQMPIADLPEVAIAGRSNVGKSTLLNRMAGRHALARVSKTPGRTRGLVVFDLEIRTETRKNDQKDRLNLRLVDLPGYGYAQVPHEERHAWQVMVEGYVKERPTLRLVLVLVDARRQLGDEEMQLMEWLQGIHVPCQVVVTKSDKLGVAERGLLREHLRKESSRLGATVAMVSGETGDGVPALWARIIHAIQQEHDAEEGSE